MNSPVAHPLLYRCHGPALAINNPPTAPSAFGAVFPLALPAPAEHRRRDGAGKEARSVIHASCVRPGGYDGSRHEQTTTPKTKRAVFRPKKKLEI